MLRPRLDSNRGIAIGCGLCPQMSDIDPYWMAMAAIDEAIRNVVCVGGDPRRTAILDNFCWGRTDDPRQMGALVRACQGCYDAAKAYGVPFISGKDSLNNEFALDAADVELVREVIRSKYAGARTGGNGDTPDPIRDGRLAIPGTLLISAVSLIDDVTKCVTMDLKQEQSQLFLIGQPSQFQDAGAGSRPMFDPRTAAGTHAFVSHLIREELVASVHDVADGGLLVACAEMALAGGRFARIHGYADWTQESEEVDRSPSLKGGQDECEEQFYFDESAGLYVVEVRNDRYDAFVRASRGVACLRLASVGESESVRQRAFIFETPEAGNVTIPLSDIREAWHAPLRW